MFSLVHNRKGEKLDYDTEDVVERLKELTAAEYSETKIRHYYMFLGRIYMASLHM